MSKDEVETFTDYCGIIFHQDENENYVGTVELDKLHFNRYGAVHGGMLYTIADTTGGMNSRRFLKKPVTLNSDFHFISNTKQGKLICTADVVHVGVRTSVVNVYVKDEKGKLLCIGTFTYYDVSV